MGLYIRLRKVVLSIFICVFIISVAEADPSISIDNGLRIVSGDDNNSFLLGGYLLVDTIPVDSHTSRLPRFDLFNAWLFMQGKVNKRFTYKIQFSLDDYSSRKLRDAFVGFEVAPGHIVQIGHFDVPTFAEHLSALSFTPLAGRSMVDSLAPGRDVGAMLNGMLLNKRAYYALGIFNGNGIDANGEDNASKDMAFRLTGRVFGSSDISGFRLYPDFTFNAGKQDRDSLLLRNEVGTRFFSIPDLDSGLRYRSSMSLYAMSGAISLRADYLQNAYRFTGQDAFESVSGASFLISYYLTGESDRYQRGVFRKVKANDTWQIVGRFSLLSISDGFLKQSALSVGVADIRDARNAHALSLGLNWLPVSNAKFNLSWIQSRFGVLSGSELGDVENVFMARTTLQYF